MENKMQVKAPINKVELDFLTITRRMDQVLLPEVDHIIGIATGGIIPACLLAYRLRCSMSLIRINYRAEDNSPQRPVPQVLEPFALPEAVKRILLVDDVSVSGQTLETAKKLLAGYDVTSFVLKGKADLVVFPEIGECVAWPWKLDLLAA
jgi:hypoxanthine phosphoribosyltransferase